MSNLEELTLYVCIINQFTFVNGTHLHNEILIHMPRPPTFNFYISTKNHSDDTTHRVSNDDSQRTFENTDLYQMACILDYFDTFNTVCHIFSLPFIFKRLKQITNNLLSIIFRSVTHLELQDKVPFKHEFFIQVTRVFPSLKSLSIKNIRPQFYGSYKYPMVANCSYSMIKYPHLISLDLSFVSIDYVDQFLSEFKKKYLSYLTELKVIYDQKKLELKDKSKTKYCDSMYLK
ncbi:unnamed protein product [Rotaria sp. Silwood1]|nr:unnamed protein product [Rotaria sp. Silwood1]